MTGISHFAEDLESVILELSSLAQMCGIKLRDPGVMDAVLREDDLIRGTNPIAFDKMRGLLALAITIVERSIAVDGAGSTAEYLQRAVEEVEERRARFGNT